MSRTPRQANKLDVRFGSTATFNAAEIPARSEIFLFSHIDDCDLKVETCTFPKASVHLWELAAQSSSMDTHPYLDTGDQIAILAHRGGNGGRLELPENTLPAFIHAVAAGATHLETDLHITSDGHLVACHDAVVADGSVHIPSTTLSDLSRLRKDGIALYPAFSDLLQACGPNARFNLDPKSKEATQALAQLIRDDPSLLERFCVGAFFDHRIWYLRRLFGRDLCTSMGPAETALFLAGGPAFADAAQVPFSLNGVAVAGSPRFMRRAKAAGLKVHVWTLNTEEEILAALHAGADGVVTDEVVLAKRLVSEFHARRKAKRWSPQ